MPNPVLCCVVLSTILCYCTYIAQWCIALPRCRSDQLVPAPAGAPHTNRAGFLRLRQARRAGQKAVAQPRGGCRGRLLTGRHGQEPYGAPQRGQQVRDAIWISVQKHNSCSFVAHRSSLVSIAACSTRQSCSALPRATLCGLHPPLEQPCIVACSRKTLIYLILTLNHTYPDYDFSLLRAHHFRKEAGVKAIEETVNSTLLEVSRVRTACCKYTRNGRSRTCSPAATPTAVSWDALYACASMRARSSL